MNHDKWILSKKKHETTFILFQECSLALSLSKKKPKEAMHHKRGIVQLQFLNFRTFKV